MNVFLSSAGVDREATTLPIGRRARYRGLRATLYLVGLITLGLVVLFVGIVFSRFQQLDSTMESLAYRKLPTKLLMQTSLDRISHLSRTLAFISSVHDKAELATLRMEVDQMLQGLHALPVQLRETTVSLGEAEGDKLSKRLQTISETIALFEQQAREYVAAVQQRWQIKSRVEISYATYLQSITMVERNIRAIALTTLATKLLEPMNQQRQEAFVDAYIENELSWLTTVHDLRSNATELLALINEASATADVEVLDRLHSQAERLAHELELYQRLPVSDRTRPLAEITRQFVGTAVGPETFFGARTREIQAEASLTAVRGRADAALAGLEQQMTQLTRALDRDIEQTVQHTHYYIKDGQRLLAALGFISLIILLVLLYYIVIRRLVQRLERLTDCMRMAVSQTDGSKGEVTALVMSQARLIAGEQLDEVHAMATALLGFVEAIDRQQQDLKEAKIQAIKANEAKSRFLATISHEIRTPLNDIIGMTWLLAQTELKVWQRDYAAKIHTSAQALLYIINDLLDFSRIEAGIMSLNARPFQLSDVLNQVIDAVTGLAAGKLLEIIVAVDSQVPEALEGDPVRLAQVLINLAGNAVKFTSQGEVVVTVGSSATPAQSQQGQITLHAAVRDTGIGIAPKQRERLFQPFSQLDSSNTRPYGGTGLGLMIARHFVQLMGGDIQVESAPGQGSTFSFTACLSLPMQDNPSRRPSCCPKGLGAIVVDPHPISSQTIVVCLESLGLATTTTGSLAEALMQLDQPAAARNLTIGLLVISIQEMDQSTLEQLRRLKADPRQSALRCLVLAPTYRRYSRTDVIAAFHSVADVLMPKPFSPASLRESVCHALGWPFLPRVEEASRDRLHLRLDGVRVLLVEDQPINQQVVMEILQLSGIKVTAVSNGAEAIACLSESPEDFDIVLMDIQMPVMDGYQATRQIRTRPALVALPIIAMTAHAMQEEREHCLQAGMNDYLSKPFEVNELLRRLAQWTSREVTSIRLPSQDNDVFRSYLGLPGIEAAAAWQRFGANRAFFIRLLRDFINKNSDTVDRLRRDLCHGHVEEAKLLLHNLKGMAGNLGAMGLYNQAAALDPLLGNSIEEVDPLLTRLARALAELRETANRLSTDFSASSSEAQNHFESDLAAGLGRLATLLACNELVAEQAFQQLHDLLTRMCQKEMVGRLEQAIEQLDFATAYELVHIIARIQGITLDPA